MMLVEVDFDTEMRRVIESEPDLCAGGYRQVDRAGQAAGVDPYWTIGKLFENSRASMQTDTFARAVRVCFAFITEHDVEGLTAAWVRDQILLRAPRDVFVSEGSVVVAARMYGLHVVRFYNSNAVRLTAANHA